MIIFRALMILSVLLVNFILYPKLPAYMPMHWNIVGEVDSYWPKTNAIWFMPGMMLGILLLFELLPALDPRKEKYAQFKREWEIIKTGMIGFFTYLQFTVLYFSLNPQAEFMPLMFIGLGSLFVLLGNYLAKIRQNYFIGIRTPWTLADSNNWNKTHRYAGWSFVIAGIITLAESYFLWETPILVFGSLVLSGFLPIIYSFLLYKEKVRYMKHVYLGLAVVALIILGIRLSGPEDTWICTGGAWVRHGVPVEPVPSLPCR